MRPRVAPLASDGKFPMVGNHRCLDFVNTEVVEQGRRVDLLEEFADLVGWLQQARVLGVAQAKQILRRWSRTSKAADALSQALAFRRVLRDRKSTRMNSSHVSISYAVFCLKKKITRFASN